MKSKDKNQSFIITNHLNFIIIFWTHSCRNLTTGIWKKKILSKWIPTQSLSLSDNLWTPTSLIHPRITHILLHLCLITCLHLTTNNLHLLSSFKPLQLPWPGNLSLIQHQQFQLSIKLNLSLLQASCFNSSQPGIGKHHLPLVCWHRTLYFSPSVLPSFLDGVMSW